MDSQCVSDVVSRGIRYLSVQLEVDQAEQEEQFPVGLVQAEIGEASSGVEAVQLEELIVVVVMVELVHQAEVQGLQVEVEVEPECMPWGRSRQRLLHML